MSTSIHVATVTSHALGHSMLSTHRAPYHMEIRERNQNLALSLTDMRVKKKSKFTTVIPELRNQKQEEDPIFKASFKYCF